MALNTMMPNPVPSAPTPTVDSPFQVPAAPSQASVNANKPMGPNQAAATLPTFNVSEWLGKNGFEIDSVQPDGTIMATDDADGTSKPVKLDKVYAAAGVDPARVNVELNNPDEPVQVSPLGILERGALKGLGNGKGQLNYLKAAYGGVKQTADGQLVVNNKGLWQAVDPAGLGNGNPWEMTKELMKDTADILDIGTSTLAAAAGATQGAAYGAVGGPPGAFAGGVIGAGIGAALEASGRTSLGRLFGTYDATPEEQAKDIALETVINMAGATIPAGMAYKASKAAEAVTQVTKTASPSTLGVIKAWLAEFMGRSSGAGTEAAETMLQNAPQVQSIVTRLEKEAGGSIVKMQELSRKEQVSIFDNLIAKQAQPALSREYGKIIKSTEEAVGDSFKFDPSGIAKDMTDLIESAGIGKFNPETKTFEKMSQAELQIAGKVAPSAETAQGIQKIAERVMDQADRTPVFKGQQGARAAFEFRKSVGETLADIASDPNAPASVKGLVPQIRALVNRNIGQQFADHSPTAYEAFAKGGKLYDEFKAGVDFLNGVKGNSAKIESVVNKAFSKNSRTAVGEDELVQSVRNLLGKRFDVAEQQLKLHNAAQAFTPRSGTGGNFIGGIPGQIINSISTPRGMLRTTQTLTHARDFMKGLGTQGRQVLLNDPKAMTAALQTIQSSLSEDDDQIAKQLATSATGQ